MIILGIETSCDECSIALVEDGKKILSHIVASQVEFHRAFNGVVPEIASRKHSEWILPVYKQAMREAGINAAELDGIAVSNRPGLTGSLIVGLSFAKGLSISLDIPFVGIDHIQAHLYAPKLEFEIPYPYLGLLVSGGHSMIVRVDDYDRFDVLGTTIDDACGEAFDKVAAHLGLGYPGGKKIDDLARRGNPRAYHFPKPNLYKSPHKYDVSYSGLKNAVINQRRQFWDGKSEESLENICASFEGTAVDILLGKLFAASKDTGISIVVSGGGVAANSYLRKRLRESKDLQAYYPPEILCTDNGAMIAGLGYEYLKRGRQSGMRESVFARVFQR